MSNIVITPTKLLFLQAVECTGTIKVEILKVINPGGFDQAGSCCDGTIRMCTGLPTCDTIVQACVTDTETERDECYDNRLRPKFKSKVYEDTNSILRPQGLQEDGVNYTNPMYIEFIKWNVSLLFFGCT